MTSDFTNSLEQKTSLTEDQIDFKENEFRDFSIVDNESVWEKMSGLFEVNSKLDEDFRLSYFRWYVDFTWKLFNNRERDLVVNICLARQIPMAILLDFDVWRNIMWYLGLRTVDRPDMESLYLRMKNAFLESDAYVGKWNGEAVVVKDLAKEILVMNTRNDSLEQAEFKSKLHQILFSQSDSIFKKYITADQDVAVERFIDLAQFFFGVDKDHIWYVVETFLHPEKYQNVPVSEAPTSLPPVPKPSTPVAVKSTVPPATPPKPASSNPPLPRPSGESPKSVVNPKLSPQQVKSQIESQFKKDAAGNFADIEGVYKKLGELAEKYDDAKINDLIYFDESSGTFKWSV